MEGVILIWLACGVLNYFIMKTKHYENSTCLLFSVIGILLGFIGLIIALCQKQITEQHNLRKTEQPNYSSTTTMLQKSNIEEIKEYKQLLDTGIITQEEYNIIKKNLLKI